MSEATSGRAEAFASAAEELVGTPFRLQGRDPDRGLDCIGLVAASLEAIGAPAKPPRGYRLRNRDITEFLASAAASGLIEVNDEIRRGDILLAASGPGQQHILIATNKRKFVHAHAGLGQVAHHSGPLDWPVIKHWRLAPEPQEPS